MVGPHGPSLFKMSVCTNRPGDLRTYSIRAVRYWGESMKMCEREGPCSVHRNAMGTTPCLLHLLIEVASLLSLRLWADDKPHSPCLRWIPDGGDLITHVGNNLPAKGGDLHAEHALQPALLRLKVVLSPNSRFPIPQLIWSEGTKP